MIALQRLNTSLARISKHREKDMKMKKFKFTDSDGRKWEVSVRRAYEDRITSGKKLFAAKQSAADDVRSRGHNGHADAIESQTIIRWAVDSGIFTWKRRLEK